MITEEVWKNVVGYEGVYQVSSCGNVRRIKSGGGAVVGRVLKPGKTKAGYMIVVLYLHGRKRPEYVHRLVASAFFGGQPSHEHLIAHFDGVRENNRVDNLRWATQSENQQDRKRHGTYQYGENNPYAKLTERDIADIRSMDYSVRGTATKIAKKYGISDGALSGIRSGRRWPNFAASGAG